MRRALISHLSVLLSLVILAIGTNRCASAASINNPPSFFPRVVTVFTSQTIACPPTATYADVQIFGGAGGGGGGSATLGAGGGGSGAFDECLFQCSAGPLTFTIGVGGGHGATSSSCTAGGNGGNTIVGNGSGSCQASRGIGGVVTTCTGGAAGGHVESQPVGVKISTIGQNGADGSGASGGGGGTGPTSGGLGGNAGQAGTNGANGLAIVTFF